MPKKTATQTLLIITLSSFIIFSSAAFAPLSATDDITLDSWVQKPDLPTSRAGPGAAVVNDKIYVIGGQVRGGGVLGTNEMYDPTTNNWTNKTSMPTPRSHIGITVYENKIFCIGGEIFNTTSQQWEYTATVQAYDTATDTWETKTPMPTARSRLQTNVVGDKIYAIGGESNQSLNYAYDSASDSWVTKAPIPNIVTEGFNQAAVYAASAVVDGKIFWIGVTGFTETMDFANQMYDPETDSWSQRATPSTHISPIAGAATTGEFATKRIYIISHDNKHLAYEPATDKWITCTPIPDVRNEVGITVLNDTIYVIGGHYLYSTSESVNQYIPPDYMGEIYQAPTPTSTAQTSQTNHPTPNASILPIIPTATPATAEQQTAPTSTEPAPATPAPSTSLEMIQTIGGVVAIIFCIVLIIIAMVFWKRQKN